MTTFIHHSFLPFVDSEKSLAFYRDDLGFEVRNDVGYGDMRWITIGSPDQPDTSIVLQPAVVDPGVTAGERATIEELMAKGCFAAVVLASDELDALFARLQSRDVEIIQEPADQPYGVRDCAVRDPAGNMVRIQQRS